MLRHSRSSEGIAWFISYANDGNVLRNRQGRQTFLRETCHFFYSLERIGLLGGFVRTVSFHTGEPERKSADVAGAYLDLIERNLGDNFRLEVDRVLVARDFNFLELIGLPHEHLV